MAIRETIPAEFERLLLEQLPASMRITKGADMLRKQVCFRLDVLGDDVAREVLDWACYYYAWGTVEYSQGAFLPVEYQCLDLGTAHSFTYAATKDRRFARDGETTFELALHDTPRRYYVPVPGYYNADETHAVLSWAAAEIMVRNGGQNGDK